MAVGSGKVVKKKSVCAHLHGGDALSFPHPLQQQQHCLLLGRVLLHLLPRQSLNLLEQLHIVLGHNGQ